jgi:ubiquinone/menaquinone biosynthesis C-methylase UbiE
MKDQKPDIKKIIQNYCKDKLVLDAGCGELPYAIEALEAGASIVYAVDIKQPKNNIQDKRFIFCRFDAQNLLFIDNAFDVVISIGLIEYINLNKGIKELKRVLKPGGILIFQTKDSRGWKHRFYKLRCKLFGKKIVGCPQDYDTLLGKLIEDFEMISYKETKPRHNFLVVLKKWEDS